MYGAGAVGFDGCSKHIFLTDLFLPYNPLVSLQVGQRYSSSLRESYALRAVNSCNPEPPGTLAAPHTMVQFSALSKQGM